MTLEIDKANLTTCRKLCCTLSNLGFSPILHLMSIRMVCKSIVVGKLPGLQNTSRPSEEYDLADETCKISTVLPIAAGVASSIEYHGPTRYNGAAT